MTGVSSRVLLTHLCTIERNQGGTDSHGGQISDFQPYLTDQPCRGWVATGKDVVKPAGGARPGEFVTLEERHLMLPLGTDVTERDRIGDVTYRGDVVLDGPHIVEAVLRFDDRLELLLRRVS